jgi:putative SOS response-associated peptidase YedK
MCGRYGFSVKDIRKVYQRFEIVNELADYAPRYNIAPGQMNPVITKNSPKRIQRMFWGLIPYWAKDRSVSFHTINARGEEIDKKPSFKKAFQSQRCLIPATGFFEWKKNIDPHVPYYIKLKNEAMFAFAGLYDKWVDPISKKELLSYTIITTGANDILKPIHPRMPVVLKREDEETWIEPDFVTSEKLLSLLKSYSPSEMEIYPVSREINKTRLDNETLINPVEKPPEQKSLL